MLTLTAEHQADSTGPGPVSAHPSRLCLLHELLVENELISFQTKPSQRQHRPGRHEMHAGRPLTNTSPMFGSMTFRSRRASGFFVTLQLFSPRSHPRVFLFHQAPATHILTRTKRCVNFDDRVLHWSPRPHKLVIRHVVHNVHDADLPRAALRCLWHESRLTSILADTGSTSECSLIRSRMAATQKKVLFPGHLSQTLRRKPETNNSLKKKKMTATERTSRILWRMLHVHSPNNFALHKKNYI